MPPRTGGARSGIRHISIAGVVGLVRLGAGIGLCRVTLDRWGLVLVRVGLVVAWSDVWRLGLVRGQVGSGSWGSRRSGGLEVVVGVTDREVRGRRAYERRCRGGSGMGDRGDRGVRVQYCEVDVWVAGGGVGWRRLSRLQSDVTDDVGRAVLTSTACRGADWQGGSEVVSRSEGRREVVWSRRLTVFPWGGERRSRWVSRRSSRVGLTCPSGRGRRGVCGDTR